MNESLNKPLELISNAMTVASILMDSLFAVCTIWKSPIWFPMHHMSRIVTTFRQFPHPLVLSILENYNVKLQIMIYFSN